MVYEIKILLRGSKPEIWRQVKINADISLNDLHKIIQTTMGWTNSHLHQFIVGHTFYGKPDDDEFGEMDLHDSNMTSVAEILQSEGQSIIYEYDFGDGWEHDIKLVKKINDEKIIHPICVDGKMNCPPEDCGGIWGYDEKLQILNDENHDEFDEISAWLGEDFDPNYFDIKEINKLLAKKGYGCIELF